MILKTLALITILVNNVRSGIITKDGNKNVRRGAYNLNHPPPAEYFSVPVAVFYEEGNRQEKSVKISVSTPKPDVTLINEEKEAVELSVTTLRSDGDLEYTQAITEKSSAETTPKISLSTDAFVTSSIMSLDLKQQDNKEVENNANKIPFPQKEIIIPVAVVYDVEPENVNRRHHKHQSALTNKTVNRRQRNKNTTKESEIPKEQETKGQPDAITSDTNIKTGTFPKRTGGKDPVVPIIQSENYVFSHSGDFHYSYEGGDGTKAFEKGALNADKSGEAVEGSFSYIGKDGKDYSLTYTADENGYRPIGAHLPTPPPIPPAIARALKYLATKPTPESITESSY